MAVSQAIVIQRYEGILRMTPSQAQVAALATLPNVAALDATLLNAAAVSVDPIVRLYQAVFGRVPDSGGLNYWVGVFAAGTTLQDIASHFAASDEFLSQYAGLTNSEIVGRMYQNVLQRAGEPEGVAFWTNFLNNGGTLAQLVLEFSQSPEFIGNSDPFVDAFLLAAADGEGIYTGSLFDLPHLGETFVLTTAVDNFTGTDGEDTFIGENSTINPADRIDGVAGTDRFDATLTGGTESLHSTNVEIFNLQALSGSPVLNMINVTGATEIWSDNSASNLTVTNVQEKALVGATGGDGSDDFTVQFRTSAVTGALDIALNDANLDDLRADDGAGTGFATLNVTATGDNSLDDLLSGGDIQTLNITGTGSLVIDNPINAAITRVDATANSGGVDLNFDNASNVTVLGGSGDDYFRFDNNFNNSDSVDGGSGRDTLDIRQQQQINANSQITSIEILAVANFFGTLDANLVDGLDTVHVTDTLGTATIDNFTNGGTVITPDSGTLFVNVTDAATGTADSFTLVVDEGADVDLNTPNVETITVNNISNNLFGSFVNLFDDTGLQNLIVQSVADSFTDIDQISSTVRLIDGSAALGAIDVVVDAGGPITGGVTINGGAAADDLTGSNGKDIILGAAGNDVIQGDQGIIFNADILTGGEGNNEFVFIGSTFAEFNVIDGTPVDAIDTITDLKLGTNVLEGQGDTINLQFAVNDVVNDGVATGLVGASLQGAVDVLFQTGGVLNNVANAAGLFTWQGDTYLVAADSAGIDFGADDVILKVTGVTGVLDTTDFV
jgi:hypothetical protein